MVRDTEPCELIFNIVVEGIAEFPSIARTPAVVGELVLVVTVVAPPYVLLPESV